MEYKLHVSASDPALSYKLPPLLNDHLPHLDRITAKFPVRSLMVSADRHQGARSCEVKLSLVLENQALTCVGDSPYLESAVSLAFRKLSRQVRILKEQFRKSRSYGKVRNQKETAPTQKEIDRLASELEKKVADKDFLGFRNRLTDSLPRLEQFLRRELQHCDGAEALANRSELARDLVEEALLHTYEKFQERPNGVDLEKWIFRHASELVESYVANAKAELLENDWSLQQIPTTDSTQNDLDATENYPEETVDFDSLTDNGRIQKSPE